MTVKEFSYVSPDAQIKLMLLELKEHMSKVMIQKEFNSSPQTEFKN